MSDAFVIVRVQSFPLKGFETLLSQSQKEGYQFLNRLQEEWSRDLNRFNDLGEAIYALYKSDVLVGIGGINADPYSKLPKQGRIRRFYIHRDYRMLGLGKMLVEYILLNHAHHFDCIGLRTKETAAAAFYEKLGFLKTGNQIHRTHEMQIKSV